MSYLKLGIIDYLNVLPVYYGIMKNHFPVEWIPVQGTPVELNQLIAQGDIDISVVSAFEYAIHSDQYYLLPNLSISANGPVRSIFLFSQIPFSQISGPVGLTPTSASSLHLVKYLLRNHDVSYFFADRKGTKDKIAEMQIGDEAIRTYYSRVYNYTYDLSNLWKEETGLPFVFAVWVVRQEAYDREKDKVHTIYQTLLRSKSEASNHYEAMAQEFNKGIFPTNHECMSYLRNLRYDFSESYQKGFLLFQQYCVELGFLEKTTDLNFIPTSS